MTQGVFFFSWCQFSQLWVSRFGTMNEAHVFLNRVVISDHSVRKYVGSHEFSMLMHASKLGLTPRILQITEATCGHFVEMEKYPFVFGALSKEKKEECLPQLKQLVSDLHANDILHGDLHSSNIVVNHDYHVKLIDFEMSCFRNEISSISPSGIAEVTESGNYFLPVTFSVDDVFAHELSLVGKFW